MFEFKSVSKQVIREYKDGKLVRERTIINDGGTSKEEAEERLKKAEDKMDRMSGSMDEMFKKMDEMFKEMF